MTYVGIDVSKVTFVVAYSSVKTNQDENIQEYRKWRSRVRPNYFSIRT